MDVTGRGGLLAHGLLITKVPLPRTATRLRWKRDKERKDVQAAGHDRSRNATKARNGESREPLGELAPASQGLSSILVITLSQRFEFCRLCVGAQWKARPGRWEHWPAFNRDENCRDGNHQIRLDRCCGQQCRDLHKAVYRLYAGMTFDASPKQTSRATFIYRNLR